MFTKLAAGLLSQIDHYVHTAAPHVKFARAAKTYDRTVEDVWFDPGCNQVIVRREQTPFPSRIPNVKFADIRDTPIQDHWCALAMPGNSDHFSEARVLADRMMAFSKSADNPTLGQKVHSALGWDDRYYKANPLAAMLATGILGAGLGYGGASLISAFLPSGWDRKKFRRSGLLLGGALGALPGAGEAAKSLLAGMPLTETPRSMRVPKEGSYPIPQYSITPTISGEELMRMTWQHPLVSNQMTDGQQALFTGAVQGASAIAGSPFFTPSDMARLTAGMGSGYASGLVAGKVLGALTGMPASTQKTLASTGMFAGALKSVLPMIYGYR